MVSREFRVKARALGFGGECVCTILDDQPQKIVFVPGLIPGEEADIGIVKEERNLLYGELISIRTPSMSRRSPPCPYFGECGGCNLQHMEIDMQRQSKLSMIESMLLKQARITPIEGVLNLSEKLPEFHYRKRVTLHINKAGELGFFKLGSVQIVEIKECLIAEPGINEILAAVRACASGLAEIVDRVEIDLENSAPKIVLRTHRGLKLNANMLPTDRMTSLLKVGEVSLVIEGEDYIISDNKLIKSRFDAGHFSQVNSSGNQVLIDAITAKCADCTVTELYAGGGNLSFPLIEAGCRITAVEFDSALVMAGRDAAQKRNMEDRISFVQMSCEEFVTSHSLSSTVILDPPRAGAKTVSANANWESVDQIVYVSCDLASLTRDLKTLEPKGFRVRRVEFIDMFPQTHHVELIAWLQRGG